MNDLVRLNIILNGSYKIILVILSSGTNEVTDITVTR